MNGIEKLSGWAETDLKNGAYIGVGMMIEHYDEISRISERFCYGNMDTAMKDIFEKGLQAMLDMCDLDDKMSETDDKSFYNQARGMQLPIPPKGGSL